MMPLRAVEPVVGEGEEEAVGDDDMVQEGDADGVEGVLQGLGHLEIGRAGLWIACRVIVDENDRGGPSLQGVPQDAGDIEDRGSRVSDADLLLGHQAVGPVEEQHPDLLVAEALQPRSGQFVDGPGGDQGLVRDARGLFHEPFPKFERGHYFGGLARPYAGNGLHPVGRHVEQAGQPSSRLAEQPSGHIQGALFGSPAPQQDCQQLPVAEAGGTEAHHLLPGPFACAHILHLHGCKDSAYIRQKRKETCLTTKFICFLRLFRVAEQGRLGAVVYAYPDEIAGLVDGVRPDAHLVVAGAPAELQGTLLGRPFHEHGECLADIPPVALQ